MQKSFAIPLTSLEIKQRLESSDHEYFDFELIDKERFQVSYKPTAKNRKIFIRTGVRIYLKMSELKKEETKMVLYSKEPVEFHVFVTVAFSLLVALSFFWGSLSIAGAIVLTLLGVLGNYSILRLQENALIKSIDRFLRAETLSSGKNQ